MSSLKSWLFVLGCASVTLGAAPHYTSFRRQDAPTGELCDYAAHPGDLCYLIAEAYNITMDTFYADNQIDGQPIDCSKLTVAQVVKVPCGVEPNFLRPDASTPCLKTHVVTPEDVADIPTGKDKICSFIGQRLSVGPAMLAAWNPDIGDACENVSPGMELCTAHFPDVECSQFHVAELGEGVNALAEKFGTTRDLILAWNKNTIFNDFVGEGFNTCVAGPQDAAGEAGDDAPAPDAPAPAPDAPAPAPDAPAPDAPAPEAEAEAVAPACGA